MNAEKDAAGRRGCVVPKRHPGDAAMCATSCWQERIGKGHCPTEPLLSAEKDAGQCGGSIPVEHTLGALPDHCSTCAEYDGPRRRTEAEARRCSQEGCPGDGRYQPPGKGHMPDCQHNAVAWVWETVTPPAERDAAVERVCMQRVGCHDYRHGTDCPMYDWPRSIDTGRPL